MDSHVSEESRTIAKIFANRVTKGLTKGWRQLSYWLRVSLPNRCMLCQQQIESVSSAHHLHQPHSRQVHLDSSHFHPSQSYKFASGICHECLSACRYQYDACLGCGYELTTTADYCGKCQRTMPIPVVAPCSYHDGIAPLITAIKYQQNFAALDALVELLAARVEYLLSCDLIKLPQVLIPVPLHQNRQRHRGFNQAHMIAEKLGARLSIPVIDDCVIKVLDTPPQAQLDGKQRRQLNAKAYQVVGELSMQRVAIIDDVVTTGSTVEAIADLLYTKGIYCQAWCLARAEAPLLKF
ncbi:ComF family protein [Shewanella maritima]|uniref:ComF family protein n=1 Tax=Shewanella maritima TaxID=2520507 RepID=UPI001F5EBC9F|nr:ComF family protein [Shewanella maritima]